MTEKVLLESGYKEYPVPVYKECDKFYQKTLSKNPTKIINVMYYDTFDKNGAIDYKYEYEYVEEREDYWYSTNIWALDKDYPYTIEEIENILLDNNKATVEQLTGIAND